jgi:hypothetical protein
MNNIFPYIKSYREIFSNTDILSSDIKQKLFEMKEICFENDQLVLNIWHDVSLPRNTNSFAVEIDIVIYNAISSCES